MPHIPRVEYIPLAPPPHINDAAAQIREWSSVIGIVTAIVGNILISFALNIQRYAHIRLGEEQEDDSGEEEGRAKGDRHQNGIRKYGTQIHIAEERVKANLDDHKYDREDGHDQDSSPHSETSTIKPPEQQQKSHERKNYLRSPYWWAGIVLMIIGEAGNFLAYGFAPASIVSPLGVVALVSNCIVAPFLLKERFRQRDFWGVMVAITGAVVVVLSAKTSETKMGAKELTKALTRWEFLLYLGITAAVILVLIWASGRYGQRTILIDLGLVGLFGGYTALSTKGVASLLSYTLWRALTFPITYLLLAVLLVSALAQIRYVNRALQHFDSTQVIPTQFVLFTISVIIGSAVLYRDFKSATADRVAKFVGGCLLTFVGVYLITSGRAGGDEGKQDHDQDDGEERIALIDEEQTYTPSETIGPTDSLTRSRKASSVASAILQPSSLRSARNENPSAPQTPVRQISRASSSAFPSPSGTSPSHAPIEPARPRPLESSISTPLLATSSDQLQPSPSRPPVPQRRSDRPSAISHHSMVRLLPGPLSSPLSSPLSAIVADSLRRGVDTTPSRSTIRNGPKPGVSSARMMRSSQSTGVGDATGGELRLGGPDVLRDEQDGDAADDDGVSVPTVRESGETNRDWRSTLGSFFRMQREESRPS